MIVCFSYFNLGNIRFWFSKRDRFRIGEKFIENIFVGMFDMEFLEYLLEVEKKF